jgi:hypothetical protein
MEWITLDAARVLADFPTDLLPVYNQWLIDYPAKAGRLAEITDGVVAEYRDAIASNPANELDPDPAKVPESCLRHAETMIVFTLCLEMGVDVSTEGTQSMTRAELFLRQIGYNHYLTRTGEREAPTPYYTFPERSGLRALPLGGEA